MDQLVDVPGPVRLLDDLGLPSLGLLREQPEVPHLLEAAAEERVVLRPQLDRGAPVADPNSLERLEKRGVSVSVVVGSRAATFHPKLWIAEHTDAFGKQASART